MKNLAFLTLEQIAQGLQVNKMTVYREIKRGKLKAGKFGKEFRVCNADFEAYLNNAYKAAEQSIHSQHSCIAPQQPKTARKAKMAKQTASKKAASAKTKASKTKKTSKTVKKKVVTCRTKPSKRSK